MNLKDWGITPAQLADALAGFVGSLVHAVRFPQPSAWGTLVVVFIGTVTANYLTDDVARYVPLSRGAIGFLIGFSAYQLCSIVIDSILRYATKRINNNGSGKPKDKTNAKPPS